MWTDDYIGIPYLELGRDRKGCDCLGLFLMVQSERFGRHLYDPNLLMSEASESSVFSAAGPRWRRVCSAVDGDALLYHRRNRGWHIGLFVEPNLMLHTEGKNGSVLERIDGRRRGDQLEGIYRYVG